MLAAAIEQRDQLGDDPVDASAHFRTALLLIGSDVADFADGDAGREEQRDFALDLHPTGVNPPEHLWALQVTQNLLPMLGVEPLIGRLFLPGEDVKGAEHEAILSHRLWQRRFAGDRDVLGKPITLNGELYTIVGVMPPEFKFAPFWATRAELWVPNALGDRAHNRGGKAHAEANAGSSQLDEPTATPALLAQATR